MFALLAELLPIFRELTDEECELLLATVADAVAKEKEKERQEHAANPGAK